MARSTYYYYANQFGKPDKYDRISSHIIDIYHTNKGRYGYRRVHLALRNLSIKINHKTVERLMLKNGLKSLVRVKKYHSYKGGIGKIAPNLLERNFDVNKPNEIWTTDVTEFKLFGEKRYLSPILDLYNGEIISYTLSERPSLMMVKDMLNQALRKIEVNDNLIIHSDQGWQYQHKTYQNLLVNNKIRQSMSRRGNCLDNAPMESFFAIFKTEFLYLQEFTSVKQFEEELRSYIDYYNNDRIKSKLKGLSPVQYRTQSI